MRKDNSPIDLLQHISRQIITSLAKRTKPMRLLLMMTVYVGHKKSAAKAALKISLPDL